MEIQHLRLRLLSIANGDVDQAKHLEAFLFSGDPRVVSGVEETMGAAIRKLRSGGSMGELPKKECPPFVKPIPPRSADAQVCTPKGIVFSAKNLLQPTNSQTSCLSRLMIFFIH